MIKYVLKILVVTFTFSFLTNPTSAVETDAVVVDADMTDATKVSGSILTNTAAGKLENLTIFNGLTASSDGFNFNNSASYLTGNLGPTTDMKKVVVEMNLKLVDNGNEVSASGSMLFGFGTNASSYVPYNIYHHSNFIGFNTFNSELYGITVPDKTNFHQYKFVMYRGSEDFTLQEIWLDGVKQTPLAYKTSGALSGTSELNSNRKFATSGGYSNGDFTFMRHPLGSIWAAKGYVKSLKVTTTTEVSAPTNSVAPAISGTKSVGQTLTSSTGTWNGTPTSYSYQWRKADTSSGTYTNISGANSSTYVLASDDVGKFLKVGVIATNAGGSSSESLSSATTAVSAVAPSAPVINSITAGDGQLSVNFTAASNGGSAITNYKYSIDGSTYTAFSPAVTTSPLVITGLTNSTSYPVTIKAVNAINDSSASNSISATPVAVVVPTDSGGSSSSSSPTPTTTPTPNPTPSASASVKPRVERINTNPLDIAPIVPEVIRNLVPGSRVNPENLIKTTIQQLSEILKPKIIDLTTSNIDPKFEPAQALQLINSQDKKVVDLPSSVINDGQTQSSRIVIVDNSSAQVITTAGGVLAVEAKSGTSSIPVDERGRVQMVKNNSVETQGAGLAPNSEFAVYLFSEPTLLGIGVTDSQGRFFASFPVEKELPLGDHTLQVNGILLDGKASSISMPVSVVDSIQIAKTQAMPKTIFVDVNPVENALNAVYWIFFVLLAILILIALTNRQKFVIFMKNRIRSNK